MKLLIIGGLALGVAVLAVSCQSDQQLEFNRYYSSGRLVYQASCQNCHGVRGEGLLALIPALTDSVFLKKNLSALPCMIRNGLSGKIAISGKTFDGQMPKTDLDPMQTAQALTYITNSFGNHLGTVTAEQVNEDLGNCR